MRAPSTLHSSRQYPHLGQLTKACMPTSRKLSILTWLIVRKEGDGFLLSWILLRFNWWRWLIYWTYLRIHQLYIIDKTQKYVLFGRFPHLSTLISWTGWFMIFREYFLYQSKNLCPTNWGIDWTDSLALQNIPE